jgi:hypothetical protein
LVYAHYFTISGANWYVLEYSANLDIAFGWVEILSGCGEYRTFSMQQLEEVNIEIPIRVTLTESGLQESLRIKLNVLYDGYWKITPMKLALQRNQSQS